MSRKNARSGRRKRTGGSNAKPKPRKAAGVSAAPPRRGVAAQMFDAPRSMWDAGLSVLSRGSKLVASPVAAGAITESLQGGLRKLEEVFDQRVLDSLARASMPTAKQLHELLGRVDALEKKISRLNRRGGKN